MNRPLSVTTAAVVLVYFGLSSAFVTFIYWSDFVTQAARAGPWLAAFARVELFVGIGVFVLGGAFMLRGLNAARLIYLAYTAVALVTNALLLGVNAPLVINGLLYGLSVYMLTTPRATAYFNR